MTKLFTTKTTRAQLIEIVERQHTELVAQARQLEAMRLELSIARVQPARVAPGEKPHPRDFPNYWDYVRAARKWSYAANKPVSYATQEDWVDWRVEVDREAAAADFHG